MSEQKSEGERTVLVAVKSQSKEAWLLPYTLENVDELIELSQCLLDQDDIPQDIKTDFGRMLELIKPADMNQ